MHLKNPLPSFFRHVDTIKEPGLHIDAQISSQNIVPGIGHQVHPNTFAPCKNKFYGFTAVVNLLPSPPNMPPRTNEALLRVNHCFPLERPSKPLFLGGYVRGVVDQPSIKHTNLRGSWYVKGWIFPNFRAEIQLCRFQGYVYTQYHPWDWYMYLH